MIKSATISLALHDQEEVCWHIPEDIGKGDIHKVRIRTGLELCFSSCTLTRELMFQYKKHVPVLLLNYNLLGQYRVQFDDQEIAIAYEGEHLGEYYHGDRGSTWQLIPSLYNQFVSIAIYKEFVDLCQSNLLEVPCLVGEYLENCENSSASRICEISPQALEMTYEILECRFSGMIRKLFLESKFLCLIVDHLEQQRQGLGG